MIKRLTLSLFFWLAALLGALPGYAQSEAFYLGQDVQERVVAGKAKSAVSRVLRFRCDNEECLKFQVVVQDETKVQAISKDHYEWKNFSERIQNIDADLRAFLLRGGITGRTYTVTGDLLDQLSEVEGIEDTGTAVLGGLGVAFFGVLETLYIPVLKVKNRVLINRYRRSLKALQNLENTPHITVSHSSFERMTTLLSIEF